MSGKLCILLLGLSTFMVALSYGVPVKRDTAVVEEEEMTREDLIIFLKSLTPWDIAKMDEEEKLGLGLLVFLYDIKPHELQKRSITKLFSKRSTREAVEEEMTREDLIKFIKSLTPWDLATMDEEEKLGLALLVFLYEIKPHELQKRSALRLFAKHSLNKQKIV